MIKKSCNLALGSLLTIGLLNCTPSDQQLPGTYAAVGYINTYDTIILKPGQLYERFVYDKSNKLSLHMNGRWNYNDGMLTMHSFFLNVDRDIIAYPELLTDTVMSMEARIETKKSKLRFCTGYEDNEYCYQQIN